MRFVLNWLFTLLLFLCFYGGNVSAQTSNYRIKQIQFYGDTLRLDTLSIDPTSFALKCNKETLSVNDYYLDAWSGKFLLLKPCTGPLEVTYRVFDIDFSKRYKHKDTSLIYVENKGDEYDFRYTAKGKEVDLFGASIQKTGSISRGVSFGNNQDLSVNSSLNLQLAGDISPNLKVLASVSDDNIPIQPDGNTNKLQEFDQIFIQIYNQKMKLIAGDFWLKKPKGYFLNYNKRAQGLYGQYTWANQKDTKWTFQGAGALSKGKFARNIIQGVEGNQGPYRLKGNENEPFIIVLAGTEKVYIDGRLLERGQEFDYTVNYNTSEVTFTTRNFITKDTRIIIEFQYSDQNFARSLFQGSLNYESKKMDYWVNVFSEQDAKNQSLQQQLSLADKQLLASVGDSIGRASSTSIDSIGFDDNQILYALVDSMGYDSVMVYNVSADSAFYRVTFSEVGSHRGNYVFDRFTALGRVYKWVKPLGGIPQGNYEPISVLLAPKRKRMISSGLVYRFNKGLKLEGELSTTNNDINTFARKDKVNDDAFGARIKLLSDKAFGLDSIQQWKFKSETEIEYRTQFFSPIQRYRSVEFDRDWNVRNVNYVGEQFLGNIEGKLAHRTKGNIAAKIQNFTVGENYLGNRAKLYGKWHSNKGFNAVWDASYLDAKAQSENRYLRHKVDVNQNLKYFKIGFKDDHELNTFTTAGDSLSLNSYQWYDWQVYLAQADSLHNKFSLFYRQRLDDRSDTLRLRRAALAKSIGGSYDWLTNRKSKLSVLASYRTLAIKDSLLINQAPENNFVGRVDYNLKIWKNALNARTFYEVGSGLELRKEFLYIEVNTGQGVYTWIDYNNDGVKDLNEFEIAQFADQASYIRVFTPSNEYTKTFSNEFNQTLFWRPERIWANKGKVLKTISRFSNQTRFRIARKTSDNTINSYNPILAELSDTSLISSNTLIRNSLFFNRTNSILGLDYVYQRVASKTLLANGFDARENEFNQLNLRWNMSKKFTLKSSFENGVKKTLADYTSGRNYNISYYEFKPSFIYQPNTYFRVSLDGRYTNKKNAVAFGGETSEVRNLGIKTKYSQKEKGSLQAEINVVDILFSGSNNNAISYEMLESLKEGTNYTWNLGYQRSISKNLQITLQYNGRKSEGNKTIHAGGLEVRAFF